MTLLLNNPQRVLEILNQKGSIHTDGHFVYKSLLHGGEYVNKDAFNMYPVVVSDFCKALAIHFASLEPDVVVGPALGGIPLSQWTAYHLSEITGKEVLAIFAEGNDEVLVAVNKWTTFRVARVDNNEGEKQNDWTVVLKDHERLVRKHQEFVLKRGYAAHVRGKKVLCVEDILNTGGSIRRVVQAIRKLGKKTEVVGVGAILNRGDATKESVGGPPEFYALATKKLVTYTHTECLKHGPCSRGISVNTDLGHGKEFLAAQAEKRV